MIGAGCDSRKWMLNVSRFRCSHRAGKCKHVFLPCGRNQTKKDIRTQDSMKKPMREPTMFYQVSSPVATLQGINNLLKALRISL